MSATIHNHRDEASGTSRVDPSYVSPDDLRTSFALAMSEMYKAEVPQYGQLVQIVREVNKVVFAKQQFSANNDSLHRLTLERHGAIRLGTPQELQTVRRIFEFLGMRAVGYYDLSVAGLPMHATCFRPVESRSLALNPFRIFTTLLRPELLASDKARRLAISLLTRRHIFTNELQRWLDVAERQGGQFTIEQADKFIAEALLTFSWRPIAATTYEEYKTLESEHPILADIACFQSAHINHLTPRTLDIDAAQEAMKREGLAVKRFIEGPPSRKCPILLRQTSFRALQEYVCFPTNEDAETPGLIRGSHKARFGEIEQRGAAVTPAGRRLYDELLAAATAKGATLKDPVARDRLREEVFQSFPDEWDQLRQQGLIYCQYDCTSESVSSSPSPRKLSSHDLTFHGSSVLQNLLDQGVVKASPITYEDFLPFSAAGIFQSNLRLDSSGDGIMNAQPDMKGFEHALGCEIIAPDILYQAVEKKSIEHCAKVLGIV